MDEAVKKQVLRLFTYGLYAVSVADNGEVNAFTANWLSQASFDPPMLMVSVENDSKSLGMIQRSQHFAVNIYESGQRDLAGALGKTAFKVPDKLKGLAYDLSATGCPLLHDALGWVECRVTASAPAGDSTIIVGEVIDVGMQREGEALTMKAAGYRHAG
ncbi:MAG TPA: flavin reductase family protein [Ktedonobacterales bacterium]|jgi:flavin reductase (DIM6/NTAB) family NADH-FMN oxidoreductase RutF